MNKTPIKRRVPSGNPELSQTKYSNVTILPVRQRNVNNGMVVILEAFSALFGAICLIAMAICLVVSHGG